MFPVSGLMLLDARTSRRKPLLRIETCITVCNSLTKSDSWMIQLPPSFTLPQCVGGTICGTGAMHPTNAAHPTLLTTAKFGNETVAISCTHWNEHCPRTPTSHARGAHLAIPSYLLRVSRVWAVVSSISQSASGSFPPAQPCSSGRTFVRRCWPISSGSAALGMQQAHIEL
jgi:hypothetical protein